MLSLLVLSLILNVLPHYSILLHIPAPFISLLDLCFFFFPPIISSTESVENRPICMSHFDQGDSLRSSSIILRDAEASLCVKHKSSVLNGSGTDSFQENFSTTKLLD